jgi:pimeloyl-ACP methyl ester carboxylesterase
LSTPALFVHGSRDPFGSVAEMEEARRSIPSRTALVTVEGAGHDLLRGGGIPLDAIVRAFRALRSS